MRTLRRLVRYWGEDWEGWSFQATIRHRVVEALLVAIVCSTVGVVAGVMAYWMLSQGAPPEGVIP